MKNKKKIFIKNDIIIYKYINIICYNIKFVI